MTRREAIEKALLRCHVYDDDAQFMADIIERELQHVGTRTAIENGLRKCKITSHLLIKWMAEEIIQAISKAENDGGRHGEENKHGLV